MQFIRTNGRGVLLCLILALPAWWLGSRFPVIGGPILAILLGMLVAIPLRDQGRMAPGIKFTSKKVLQWAVILLGFGLDLTVVLRTGKQSLPIILCTITASLVIAFVLHKSCIFPVRSQPSSGLAPPSAVGLPLPPPHRSSTRTTKRSLRPSPSSSSLMYWPPSFSPS